MVRIVRKGGVMIIRENGNEDDDNDRDREDDNG